MARAQDAYVHVTTLERDPTVRTGPTTAIPRSFSAEIDDPEQPYLLDLRVRTIAGRRPEVVELRLELRSPQKLGGIATEGLRGVHIAKALQMAVARAIEPIETEDDRVGATKPLRGVPVTKEFLGQVANVYRSAVAGGSRAPVVEVARQLGGSRPTAGRWVVQARKAGVLKPAIGTRAGESMPKTKRPR
jgi:hypothetical protein